MLKSILSVPISSVTERSVNTVPNDGLVKYHASLSLGSVSWSTLHSAQPLFSASPLKTVLRYLTNTVPLDTGVGGVPQNIVCGFLLSVTTYFKLDSWSS